MSSRFMSSVVARLVVAGIVVAIAPAARADINASPVPGAAHLLRLEVPAIPPNLQAPLVLVDGHGHRAVPVRRDALPDATAPVALAVVVNGQEVWMGNTTMEPPDSPARYGGALDGVAAAMTTLAEARVLPPGSQAALISYADGVDVLTPLGDPARLARALGGERTYYGKVGSALFAGVSRGLDTLASAPQPRRVLLVIGDGNDRDPSTADVQGAQLAERAARAGVTIIAVVWKGALSSTDTTTVTAVTPWVRTAVRVPDIGAEAIGLFEEAAALTAVTFDARAFAWDGTAQSLQLLVGEHAWAVRPVVLPAPSPGRTWWWIQLGAGVALVLVSAGLLTLRARMAATR